MSLYIFSMGAPLGIRCRIPWQFLDDAADLLLIKMRQMSVRNCFFFPHRSAFTRSTAALDLDCVLVQVQWNAP